MTSLNPVLTASAARSARRWRMHPGLDKQAAEARASDLHLVGIR